MYRQENRTEFDLDYRRPASVIERREPELLIAPREAPIPGQELRSVIAIRPAIRRLDSARMVLAACLLLLVGGLAYGRPVMALAYRWSQEPGLSYAFLVPVFSAYLLWFRRDERPQYWHGSWWGLAIVLVGGCVNVIASWSYYDWLRLLPLPLTLSGICVLAGGRSAWHWCWPAVMFLGFALPLPAAMVAQCGPFIQRWTAAVSAYGLVAMGFPAVASGGELIVDNTRIAVLDAGNGLTSFVACLAVCSAVVLMIQVPLWERVFILLSAAPIALVGNVVRLAPAAVLQESAGSEAMHVVVGGGGWLLVPLALGLVWVERKILAKILVPVGFEGPLDLQQDGVRI